MTQHLLEIAAIKPLLAAVDEKFAALYMSRISCCPFWTLIFASRLELMHRDVFCLSNGEVDVWVH